MAMHGRLGLVEGAGLTEGEVYAVLTQAGVRCVTERIHGAFYDLIVDGAHIRRGPTDPGVVATLTDLFASGAGAVSYEMASYAELCVLLPRCGQGRFLAARAVPGVSGWSFKNLETALAELENAANAVGEEPPTTVLRRLDRALELGVAVVFGERERTTSAFGERE